MQKHTFLTRTDAGGETPTVTITTSQTDRDSDVVVPQGAVLANYLKNPVVLFAHDYNALPVGRCTSISAGQDGLVASWQWLEGDEFAARVKNAWQAGCLNAASIGFRPLAVEPLPTGGTRFTQWELLEFSIVPVPANPGAVRQLKAFGLSGKGGDEAVLDVEPSATYELEDIARAVKTAFLQRARPEQKRAALPIAGDFFASHHRHEQEFDVTPDQMRHALREGIRSVLADVVTETVNAELRRRSGRLD